MPSYRQLEKAFTNCVSMQSINLNTDITISSNKISYADYAFAGCRALTTVDVGDYFDIEYYEQTNEFYAPGLSFVSMFEGCSSLTTVTGRIDIGFVGSIQKLKDMFKGCTNLRRVEIGCGVKDTENYIDLMAQNVTIDGVTYTYAYEYLGLNSEYVSVNGIAITYSTIMSTGG